MTQDNLERYRVNKALDIYYISGFLSQAEQDSIWNKVYSEDKKWVQLQNRRLQAHPSQLLGGNTLVKAPLPLFLTSAVEEKFKKLRVFEDTVHGRPNHVLINEYAADQGIDPHEDGSVYCPLVATISLGSHCIYELYDKTPQRTRAGQLLQEPGSCMITIGETYSRYLHGIRPTTTDEIDPETILNWSMLRPEYQKRTLARSTRISLTYRDVIKEKALLRLGR